MKGKKTENYFKVIEGECYESNYGVLKVIKINSAKDVIVTFLGTGYTRMTTSVEVRSGRVKDLMKPIMYGVGFIGEGAYPYKENKVPYHKWHSMLKRCYSGKDTAYAEVVVCSQWHNFQNFAEWFYNQTGHDKVGWELDKDILIKGNREYGPDACCLVPTTLNGLIIDPHRNKREDQQRGQKTSSGALKPYRVVVSLRDAYQVFGEFATKEEAFSVYKIVKQAEINKRLNEFTDELDPRVVKALQEYYND